MNDPIVAEIRHFRQEHAQRFQLNLAAICADLRKLQQDCGHPVVTRRPKKCHPVRSPKSRKPVVKAHVVAS
jgi:hypothetical protein